MAGTINYQRNTRMLRIFSLLYLGLVVAALLLVHASFYEPAVSYILFYLVAAAGITAAGVVLLLPAQLFTDEFVAGAYVLYAALVGLMVFFSGGVSSELHVLYFPLLLFAALHGVWSIGLAAVGATIFVYFLAVMPDLLSGLAGDAGLALFRLVVLALVGGLVLAAARVAAGGFEEYATDEDGSMLLEVVEGEISAGREEQVAVILVDPGRGIGNTELLLGRVRDRIAEPILLGGGNVFGMVLSGVDERSVESAAGRALAVAASLGARHSLAGAAIYPRDARSAEGLLAAAGKALEAAFEPNAPAVVLAGRTPQNHYRVAR
ncbi:MAG: hypothetical protein ACFB50_00235 [Rubrobacteraceae bacterium]